MRFSTFVWACLAIGFLSLAVLMWIAGIWVGGETGPKFGATGGVLMIPTAVAGIVLLARSINESL
jgi:hypothetical protein